MHCCDASQTIHCGVDGKRPVKIGKTSDWRVGCHQNLLRLQPCGLASPTDCKRRIWGEQGCSSAICASYSMYSSCCCDELDERRALHQIRSSLRVLFQACLFLPCPQEFSQDNSVVHLSFFDESKPTYTLRPNRKNIAPTGRLKTEMAPPVNAIVGLGPMAICVARN